MSSDDKKIEIQDELSKIQIEQLHKTTLNFSAQSFEIKKFCIVTIATVSTIILGINPERWILCCFILATTFLFYRCLYILLSEKFTRKNDYRRK